MKGKQNEKTNKKLMVALTVAALLVVGWGAISNLNTETASSEAIQMVEPATARIDIFTKP